MYGCRWGSRSWLEVRRSKEEVGGGGEGTPALATVSRTVSRRGARVPINDVLLNHALTLRCAPQGGVWLQVMVPPALDLAPGVVALTLQYIGAESIPRGGVTGQVFVRSTLF